MARTPPPDARNPRTAPENVEAMLEAGAEGAFVQFSDEAAIRDFAAAVGSSAGEVRLHDSCCFVLFYAHGIWTDPAQRHP